MSDPLTLERAAPIFWAVLASWLALGLEWAALQLTSGAQFAGLWEVQYGTLWLLPTALALASLVGACVGLLLIALELDGARLTFAGAVAFGAALVAYGVSTGRHFNEPAVRSSFVGLSAVAAGYAAFALHAPWNRWTKRGLPVVTAVGAGFAALTGEIVNRFLFVRLYPAFHWALAAATLASAGLALRALAQRRETPALEARSAQVLPGIVAVTVVLLLALGTALPAARRLAGFDNFRWTVSHAAPLWGIAVEASSWLVPPPPIQPLAEAATATRAAGVSAAPKFEGRDVLLITIDALRADHVGSYGYARPTTPNLDALAKTAVVFDHAYCATPHTSYSVTSLLTGKYVRPLLLQGAGEDSETIASLLRAYGYRTAAFYPPAVFFIDEARFQRFRANQLGFEYQKVEFLEGQGRVRQVAAYLDGIPPATRAFTWVHLFEPHEPYEAHPEHDFGSRDIDRYDAEIRSTDDTVAALVALARKRDPRAVVIVTADHGEEFGEHGGRYHGSSVYEEQVRVPLLFDAPGALTPRRVGAPVQTIDILPTLLDGLAIPPRPRIRGRSLGPELLGTTPTPTSEGAAALGFAYAETSDYSLWAEGTLRLVCARKVGACTLHDLAKDPGQKADIAAADPARFEDLKARLHAFGASHGRFEQAGLRAEGKGWPAPILRGLSGDVDAAVDVASLLDDADVAIRRKAAEVLFDLGHPGSIPALRLALRRDDDAEVRAWSALTLTRLGEGASLATDLLGDPRWQRFAALALAESNDDRGEVPLVSWWLDAPARDFERSRQLLNAFTKLRSRVAVWPLVQSLDDVRLRPLIADTLAAIGDDDALGPLAAAFSREPYQKTRVVLARALLALGAKEELARPLVRFLGVPDPIEDGLSIAHAAGILEHVGGPSQRQLDKLRHDWSVGARVRLVIPKAGNGTGFRLLVRARTTGERAGNVTISPQTPAAAMARRSRAPTLDPVRRLAVTIPGGAEPFREYAATVPADFRFSPGLSTEIVVFAEHDVELSALAIVPLADELPPPAPKPWKPGPAEDGKN